MDNVNAKQYLQLNSESVLQNSRISNDNFNNSNIMENYWLQFWNWTFRIRRNGEGAILLIHIDSACL